MEAVSALVATAKSPKPEEEFAGLSTAEARRLLLENGPNELTKSEQHSLFGIVVGVLREPMFLLLLGCSTLYFMLGDYDEAGMLLSFVLFIIFIAVMQERRTEKALEALHGLVTPTARVIRDGFCQEVKASELVVGDTVVLREGDCVPCDMVLINSSSLLVDESLLTGESAPVSKVSGGADDLIVAPSDKATSTCFAGTYVVSGKAVGVVKFVGEATQLGKIGKTLADIREERTLVHREVDYLIKQMAIVGVACCVIVFVAYALLYGQVTQAALTGLSLAMGVLPEEFPVILTVFLAIGALRISYKNVLVRKNAAIESLSSCTVVCTDKTGTLTVNSMVLDTVATLGASHTFAYEEALNITSGDVTASLAHAPADRLASAELQEVIEYAMLSCQRHPHDPMEVALLSTFTSGCMSWERAHANWTFVKEYPFNRDYLMTACAWAPTENATLLEIAAKGAPDSILRFCKMSASQEQSLRCLTTELMERGLRVLAVCKAKWPVGQPLPQSQHEFSFNFLGVVAFTNPIRSGVVNAVSEAHEAGLRVVMVTGDAADTAQSVAAHVGIAASRSLGAAETAGAPAAGTLTGRQIQEMDSCELTSALTSTSVFARVLPEQVHK
eukprot:TRINITY_DN5315_c0_g1_i1.p1 TRINITY_DN5315_c0_g1~~TRINITY_DN5315_c0_g1_i1.p1  ORF type:complete len:650 (-),score=153.89 TRINITY_DN5315_c0_g1_i1:1159-3006(-)